MAVIPAGVSDLFHTIVSYLILMLWIMFFVKLFHLFGGLGGGFGGGKGGPKTTKKPEKVSDGDVEEDAKKKKKTDEEKRDDETKKRVSEDKFDPYNCGYIKFLVTDEDKNPIPGVEITITPSFAKTRSGFLGRKKNKDTWREYNCDVTDVQGFSPSRNAYHKVGSGVLKIDIKKKNFTLLFPGRMNKKKYETYEMPANEKVLEIVTMKRRGEKAETFEAHIINVKADKDYLHMKGVIK